jgi:hypothetical protein
MYTKSSGESQVNFRTVSFRRWFRYARYHRQGKSMVLALL